MNGMLMGEGEVEVYSEVLCVFVSLKCHTYMHSSHMQSQLRPCCYVVATVYVHCLGKCALIFFKFT